MAMDRKYRYALEKAGLTEAEVDLRFQRIDRRMENLHIGDRLYEIVDSKPSPNWGYESYLFIYAPLYEWTVTSIIDKEYGIIGATNEKYGTSEQKGDKEKSILNLRGFEEGFEMCQCMLKESEWKYKEFSDDFYSHYPDYWDTDNKPLTFYASDMYGNDYLIEHSIPNFKVSVLIDAKKKKINFSIDVSPDFKDQAIELLSLEAQYKKVALMGDDIEPKSNFMLNYKRGLCTAMALRSQSIGDLITAYVVSYEADDWKRNYLFPICNFEVPSKCYYWSLPLFNFLQNRLDLYFQPHSSRPRYLKYNISLMVTGNKHALEDHYRGAHRNILLKLSTSIVEACEKRNFKNCDAYEFASEIIKEYG